MRETQRKGDIATTQAIASFTRAGCDVSIPVTESAAYDLIVDINNRLYRVQNKFSSLRDVDLRRVHNNAQGYVVKPAFGFDILYIFTVFDTHEYLILRSKWGTSITPKASDAFELVIEKLKMEGSTEIGIGLVLKTSQRITRCGSSTLSPSANIFNPDIANVVKASV